VKIRLHKNATTTPRTRQYIQTSNRPVRALMAELGVSERTVRRWKGRDQVEDRPHTAHRLHTTLSPAEEYLVVELRKLLLLPLDDLLRVTREFLNPRVSRSGLDRCLRRHGVGTLRELLPETEPTRSPKTFKAYTPGYVHVDVKYLPQMPDEAQRRYLFVAIDRASRWVYLEIRADKSAQAAAAFLRNLTRHAPFVVRIVLTDNGKEFTDRFCITGERSPTGHHRFDQACASAGIEHRLIRPNHPQTNGMVERFNGRIAALLQQHRFGSRAELEETLHRYVTLYNAHLHQKALNHLTPLEKLQQVYQTHPEGFLRKPVNRTGPDS